MGRPRVEWTARCAVLVAVSRVEHNGGVAPLHCDGDVLRELVRPVLARQQAACRLHCSSEFAQHPLRAAVPAAIGKQHEGDELHRIAVASVGERHGHDGGETGERRAQDTNADYLPSAVKR